MTWKCFMFTTSLSSDPPHSAVNVLQWGHMVVLLICGTFLCLSTYIFPISHHYGPGTCAVLQSSPGCIFSFCRCSHNKWSVNRLQLGSAGVRHSPGLSHMQVWKEKEVLNHVLGQLGCSLSIHFALYWSQICPQFWNTLSDLLNMNVVVP